MPKPQKPRGRRLGFFEAQDKMLTLNALYKAPSSKSQDRIARQVHKDLDDVTTPDPPQDLEDSELSDSERNSAIARERARRAGLIP